MVVREKYDMGIITAGEASIIESMRRNKYGITVECDEWDNNINYNNNIIIFIIEKEK